MGSSTETVAFRVYEILKINHELLQFTQIVRKLIKYFQRIFQLFAQENPQFC